MKFHVQLVADLQAELLEGPVFDPSNMYLYFVSIYDYRAYRFNPKTKDLIYIQLASPTSCIFISDSIGIVAASTLGFFKLDFDTLDFQKIFEIQIPPNTRFNDGTLDPQGRFLIGTMGYPEIVDNIGAVLSYKSGVVKKLIEGTTISNGIVFSEDTTRMFFIDTPKRTIAVYQYDVESGNCNYLKDLADFKGAGVPDGMDIDESGNLWVAEWGGYCVSVWDSITGGKIGTVDIPMQNVTSVCFDNNKNLYVTTARSCVGDEPKGGALFYVKIDWDV